MGNSEIRNPIQKRSIEKKEKIIQAGFELFCTKGYYNTNTAEIAKAAGVSTGIVYNYFSDKHDILIDGINAYAQSIFYPMMVFSNTDFNATDLDNVLKDMIKKFIENHKLSKLAHEEIMAMTHSDEAVASIFHNFELKTTNEFTDLLLQNNFKSVNLKEKVHISIGIIDNLCHEIVYHKHENIDYDSMIDIVVRTIINLLK